MVDRSAGAMSRLCLALLLGSPSGTCRIETPDWTTITFGVNMTSCEAKMRMRNGSVDSASETESGGESCWRFSTDLSPASIRLVLEGEGVSQS